MNLISDEYKEQEEETKTFVALCYNNKILGISVYDELTNTIYADSITASSEDMADTVANLKSAFSPSLFLLSPRIVSNQALFDLIVASLDGIPDFYRHKVLKSSSWNQSLGIEMIHRNVTLKDSRNQASVGESFQRISSMIDLDSEQLLQSLAALLSFMQTSVFNLDDGKIVIAAIKSFSLQSYMRIDSGSLRALQIFAEEVHPNVLKGVGRSKEGFSLFGLFDRTCSVVGRQKLKDWMSKPLFDLQKIKHRQEGVSIFVRSNNTDVVKIVSGFLKHVSDIPRLILRIKKVESSYVDWCKLHSSLTASVKIIDQFLFFVNNSGNVEEDRLYIRELCSQIEVDIIRTLVMRLEDAIDFEQSQAIGNSVVIKEGFINIIIIIIDVGFNAELDEKRDLYENIENYLVQAAHRVLDLIPLLENVSVEYIPQVGYLVAVASEYVHLLEIAIDNDNNFNDSGEGGFKFVYCQDNIHYFKHPIVLDLDDSLGDIKSTISDLQKLILLNVEDDLLEMEPQLQILSSVLSTVDVLMSLGVLAAEQNLVKPEIVEASVVMIKGGRHLLQEMTVDNFVPNDTYINEQINIALITGPNTSGKSVYLKQVGLIVFLAHIGSYIPCEKAIIGLTDQILTRINSVETVSSPHSSFALDLTQTSRILSSHTPRSLCLLDEFGKGTAPVDGIALLAATVKHFVKRKGKALFVLHFTEIVHADILNPQDMECLKCYTMETFLATPSKDKSDSDDDNDEEEVTPLFKLKLGVATSSEGIPCAKKAGIPIQIIERSQEVKANILGGETIQTSKTEVLSDPHHRLLLRTFLETEDWMKDLGSDQVAIFRQ